MHMGVFHISMDCTQHIKWNHQHAQVPDHIPAWYMLCRTHACNMHATIATRLQQEIQSTEMTNATVGWWSGGGNCNRFSLARSGDQVPTLSTARSFDFCLLPFLCCFFASSFSIFPVTNSDFRFGSAPHVLIRQWPRGSYIAGWQSARSHLPWTRGFSVRL
jgi:hypothetical protein